MFWILVCSRMSLINLIFSPMYLPFINPVAAAFFMNELFCFGTFFLCVTLACRFSLLFCYFFLHNFFYCSLVH